MIARADFDWDVHADLRRRPEDKPWLGSGSSCRDDDGVAQGWANYVAQGAVDGHAAARRPPTSATCARRRRLPRLGCGGSSPSSTTSPRSAAGDRPVDELLPWLLHRRPGRQADGLDRFRVGPPARRARPADRPHLRGDRPRGARGRRRAGPRRWPLRPRRLAGRCDVRRHRRVGRADAAGPHARRGVARRGAAGDAARRRLGRRARRRRRRPGRRRSSPAPSCRGATPGSDAGQSPNDSGGTVGNPELFGGTVRI